MRIDDILQVIESYSKNHTIKDIVENRKIGLTVYDIAEELKLFRNNVNSDLIKLYKENKVIKITYEKTYRYYSSFVFSNITGVPILKPTECKSLVELLNETNDDKEQDKLDPFMSLIGYRDSMKQAIISAKASLIYPGGPLNTLLLGESGVGKSLFAEMMFEYGKINGQFSKDSNLVIFNCADYANNSELLLSQLFGNVKGAYTGAEITREGLLQKADKGVLFLDEIHRLPPEGQEMLFYFIDKKKYRMLGETTSEHEATVTLIFATTESPDNYLLTTFIRRIPMIIKIPNLKEKTLYEKKQLVLHLFGLEAMIINKELTVDKDVMITLLMHNPKGNIGQLKNDIKLAVARSYLDCKVFNLKQIKINNNHIPKYAIQGLSDINIENRREIEVLLNKEEFLITPKETLFNIYKDNYFSPPNLRANSLSVLDSFEEYVERVSLSINNNNMPSFIIDSEIREITSFIHEWVFRNMEVILDRSQSATMAFYLKNIKEDLHDSYSFENLDCQSNLKSMERSRTLIKEIKKNFNIRIPGKDVYTLACILDSFVDNKIEKININIFVIAHGISLATNISDVVNSLLAINYVQPVDMPLDKNINDIIDYLVDQINLIPIENEILLFVDMGSLTSLEEIIYNKIERKITVIPTISTLIVLDSVRKAYFLKYSINSILSDILKMSQKIEGNLEQHIKAHLEHGRERILYTICYSGEGTASYLEKYLKKNFEENSIYDIEIIPLSNDSIVKVRNIIEITSKGKNVIGIIGSLDPGLPEYPYISIEEMLIGNGIEQIFELIFKGEQPREKHSFENFERDVFIYFAFESIDKYLMYLDSKKINVLILTFIENMESDLNVKFNNNTLVKLIVHMSCMIENLLFSESTNLILDNVCNLNENTREIINKNLDKLEYTCNIIISPTDRYYIESIIESDTHVN